MERKECGRSQQAIDAEEMPTPPLQPAGKPLECQQTSQEGANHAQEAGREQAPRYGRTAGFVMGSN